MWKCWSTTWQEKDFTVCENAELCTSVVSGFFLVWISMCLFNIDFYENADPQTSQGSGFTPVCDLMCVFKLELFENPLPHSLQV